MNHLTSMQMYALVLSEYAQEEVSTELPSRRKSAISFLIGERESSSSASKRASVCLVARASAFRSVKSKRTGKDRKTKLTTSYDIENLTKKIEVDWTQFLSSGKFNTQRKKKENLQ